MELLALTSVNRLEALSVVHPVLSVFVRFGHRHLIRLHLHILLRVHHAYPHLRTLIMGQHTAHAPRRQQRLPLLVATRRSWRLRSVENGRGGFARGKLLLFRAKLHVLVPDLLHRLALMLVVTVFTGLMV